MTEQCDLAISLGGDSPKGSPMLDSLKRHEVQVLLRAGHKQAEVVRLTGVSERSVRRIAREPAVVEVSAQTTCADRGIGRPSTVEDHRAFVEDVLSKEPTLMTLELLRRARLRGYEGGKSAFYELVRSCRPRGGSLQMRFEGLPGEFSQHDFGQVDVAFMDGSCRRIHFFTSRLKWSRWTAVTIVPDQSAETLIRSLAEHFVAFGGMPLLAVFDRPKTVALSWRKNGEVTEWNPMFAYAALELGFGVEVCWPYQPRQKGSVESIVKWVKGSFFKQRRFLDEDDLFQQLGEWLRETNTERPNRATAVVPEERRRQELPRLRKPKVAPEDLALRVPVHVGPTAVVVHDTHAYSMPPEAAGIPGTLYLYRERVRIVAGRFEAEHPRQFERGKPSTLPEHRAARLAAVSGKRGRRYLKRQDLLETGEAAAVFLTELVHRQPGGGWVREVDDLHELLQLYGPEPLHLAMRTAVEADQVSAHQVASYLGHTWQACPWASDAEVRP